MDFYEVVDKVVDLLRSRRRVTYRSLKAQFQLDDEQLETLREEILYAHESSVRTDDRGFTWTDETEDIQVMTTSQSDQAEPQPVIESDQPTQVASQPAEPHTPDAERRQLTVMFVDMVGSTSLSGQLDPEDLRNVVLEYQKACTEVIQRYDGHVAQLLGDGLLVYFGYPQAHEDDAQRAVRTGLSILQSISVLSTQLEQVQGIKLAVRLGIHTGLVVIGEMGGAGHQEQLALGETPNLAARIQGLAEPDMVVMSAETYRLTQGFFDVETLGAHALKGVSQPVAVYRILGDSGLQNRLDVASTRGLTPLVGREQEVGLLLDRWNQVKDSQGQVVLLSGEAGIGKSRAVQVLKDHVADEAYTRLECRSSLYFTNSALYPIIDMMQRTLQWHQDDTPEERLEKLEHNLSQYRLPLQETVPLFAPLLSVVIPEDRYPPLNLSPQRQRQKTLETIVTILLESAEREPVLFILEDLHWTDPTTLELLDLLINQSPTASICTLLTCRPTFQPPWSSRSYLTQVTLSHLSHRQTEQLATQVAGGKTLPTDIVQQLVDKTDGVPLYVEEMTKSMLESGHLKETNDHYELTGTFASLAIPATLQDSLMARLDRLMTAKVIAQLGATIGRQFGYELLHAVAQIDEETLQRELNRLVEAELLYQRGLVPHATYTFKHALIQDTAYESLLRSTRQGYHRRIAEVLEEQFPETAENQPELLAHHYTEAGLNEQAIEYWYKAGQRAIERSANMEAISHLNKGLELLKTLPDTLERAHQELDVQIALGPALIATKGNAAPDAERTYARARELCQQLGDTPQLFPVLRGLMLYYQARGQLQTAYQFGEQLLRLAQSHLASALLLLAHHQLGMVLCHWGELTSARTHHTQALAIYTPQEHQTLALRYGMDLGVASHSFLAWELWQLGYPDQALQQSQEAGSLAQEVSHAHSRTLALAWAAVLHQCRREASGAQERAETALTLATEEGFEHWLAWVTILHGWALVTQGHEEAGMAEMRQSLDAYMEMGAKVLQPYFLGLLAEAYGEGGHLEEGWALMDEALAVMGATEARFYQAELYRLKGALLWQTDPDASEVEICFQQALDIAQHQSAKSWELRAATSLARLWESQDKRQEAHDLLAPVYGWFTEGFDTADLKDAKELLNELEGGR